MRQVRNVDTAGSNISRDKHSNLIRLEGSQCTLASGLTFVAMNGHRADALLVQISRKSIRTMLSASEHEHLIPIAVFNHLGEEF